MPVVKLDDPIGQSMKSCVFWDLTVLVVVDRVDRGGLMVVIYGVVM